MNCPDIILEVYHQIRGKQVIMEGLVKMITSGQLAQQAEATALNKLALEIDSLKTLKDNLLVWIDSNDMNEGDAR